MDFFGAQEQARSQTRRLIVLFSLAVVAVIVAVYLALTFLIIGSGNAAENTLWRPELFLMVAGATSLLITGGSLYKISALASGGGETVAEMLGGRRVARNSDDMFETRLLNVVEEMALASGVPVPKVYILDEESGINAFAAGFTTQQAVVAVTRGCLEQLSRDELQGVIAHEFSHILNGDMRLNLRLIGILHGILLLALIGRVILRGTGRSRSKKGGGGIVAFGLALLVIGYIGVFFGNLIKAAASRQREFLADASAVQFTRNPAGIAGALKKIGGLESSEVRHPRAEEASHMFFGEGISHFFNWLATHPPIEERIRRLDRSFRIEQPQKRSAAVSATSTAAGFAAAATALTPQQVVASVGTMAPEQVAHAHNLIASLPASIRTAINSPGQARSLIYALLVVEETLPLQRLQQTLTNEPPELLALAASHVATLHLAGRATWLPILELATPELVTPGDAGMEQLLANTKRLIESDGRVTLFEYLVDSLLRSALRGKPGDKGTIHRYAQKNVQEDSRTVLSLLAHLGHREPMASSAAFTAANAQLHPDSSLQQHERSALSLPRFDQALTRLATLDYRYRARLIAACTVAITHDNQITFLEADLLRLIGAKLDCPIPPLLAGA